MPIIDRQLEIMTIAEEIGGIAECNGPFMGGLARKIGERDITEMTVGELLVIYRQYS